MSMARCGASCAASTRTRAPCRCATAATLGQRPQLAGDVRGAGDDDQTVASAADAARAVSRSSSAYSTLGGTGSVVTCTPARLLPGQQRRVVLGLEDEDLGAARQAPGEQVRRVGGVAGEDDEVVVAGADEPGDLDPGLLVPRGGDAGSHTRCRGGREEYVSRAVSTAALTLTSDGVDAAWSRLAYSTSPVRVGTRSPAADDGRQLAGGGRSGTGSPSRTMRSLVRDAGRAVGVLGASDGHDRLRRSGDLPGSKVRACRRRMPAAGSSSGAPHRGGGLLASKPELCAGTHDRASRG